jgi:hypothetical protein
MFRAEHSLRQKVDTPMAQSNQLDRHGQLAEKGRLVTGRNCVSSISRHTPVLGSMRRIATSCDETRVPSLQQTLGFNNK